MKEIRTKTYCYMLHNYYTLQFVMGSSKLASLREPLLQLDLILENKNSKRILDLELNKDELDTFINTMENIVLECKQNN